MSRIDQYREGYEQGKEDSLAEKFLSSTINIVRDEDYNKGYADAAAGRSFDPPYDD